MFTAMMELQRRKRKAAEQNIPVEQVVMAGNKKQGDQTAINRQSSTVSYNKSTNLMNIEESNSSVASRK